jgi:putative protease
MSHKPEILAPAGDRQCLLAAVAAGADAVYLGLKHFSARMQAENFSVKDLAQLAETGRAHGVRLYVAVNTLIKPDEPAKAGRLIDRLERHVHPDALIVQDLGTVELARQAGYSGEIHLSTLANVSHPAALAPARALGASRVVLPRELNVDEVRAMADACPEGLDLEVFVHGALCFCVSGRCYWSSWLGGKSGLRGRCVQPCRRLYAHRNHTGRYFSCKDLSLDVLVKPLTAIERVRAWKIEGRKKGPHYVYYVTTAYRMLRDAPDDPQVKKQALDILSQALGRPASHYHFLPQAQHNPTDPSAATGSGLLAGKIAHQPVAQQDAEQAGKGAGRNADRRKERGAGRGAGQGKDAALGREDGRATRRPATRPEFRPRFALLPGDLLRVGYEDEPWHRTVPVTRSVPKGGKLTLPPAKGPAPKAGTPVFLVDRREPELMARLRELEAETQRMPRPRGEESEFTPSMPARAAQAKGRPLNVTVRRRPLTGKDPSGGQAGLWLSQGSARAVSRTLAGRTWWWLPPVIWPEDEEGWRGLVRAVLRNGGRRFVLGAPWQVALFADAGAAPQAEGGPEGPGEAGSPETGAAGQAGRWEGLELIAGPFCNASNALALQALADLGFSGAIVSPELTGEDLLALPGTSPLPLGIVIAGNWPVGVSRIQAAEVKPGEELASPKNEIFHTRRYGADDWIYPDWPLDLGEHRAELARAGYTLFVTLEEPGARTARGAARRDGRDEQRGDGRDEQRDAQGPRGKAAKGARGQSRGQGHGKDQHRGKDQGRRSGDFNWSNPLL